ncbi:angiopoietin-related protein 7-like [Drosophila albomicans]|uniref:Angiopoietin-related protein 7-like n=1 Tax=Drosophila albomicans TaxID=7291 RepID=A0A6P8WR73_DROAB|nr:angiopoietin-related protein 7-like [Drosophila albomicans]
MCKIKINSVLFLIVLEIFLVTTSAFEETHESDREMEKQFLNQTSKSVKPLLDYFRPVRTELEDSEIKEKKLNELNSDLIEKYHDIVRIHEKFMKEEALLDKYKTKILKGENDMQLCQNKVEELESKIKSQKQIIDKLTPISKLYDECKKEVAEKSNSLESSEVQLKQLKSRLFEKDENIWRLNANIEKTREQHQTLIDILNKTLPNTIIPSSCSPFGDSPGVHQLNDSGIGLFDVLCDSQLAGPGWIVIQQRVGGNESFNRNWATYRKGFGAMDSDFFLGLEKIHRITSLQRFELYLHLVTLNGSTYNARYDDFKISDEDSGYKLSLGKFSGTIIEDAMKSSENTKFTTFDRDNDINYGNCAIDYESGWWHTNCYDCNLNAPYGPALNWFVGYKIYLKEAKMLIRPKRSDEEVSK